ncbi:hypothetical protein F5B21DRAFT_509137 [Xylaria acuta]|nr:hypothetical protein F5B21DRAFT_509137 [Xylaria acuta]
MATHVIRCRIIANNVSEVSTSPIFQGLFWPLSILVLVGTTVLARTGQRFPMVREQSLHDLDYVVGRGDEEDPKVDLEAFDLVASLPSRYLHTSDV